MLWLILTMFTNRDKLRQLGLLMPDRFFSFFFPESGSSSSYHILTNTFTQSDNGRTSKVSRWVKWAVYFKQTFTKQIIWQHLQENSQWNSSRENTSDGIFPFPSLSEFHLSDSGWFVMLLRNKNEEWTFRSCWTALMGEV